MDCFIWHYIILLVKQGIYMNNSYFNPTDPLSVHSFLRAQGNENARLRADLELARETIRHIIPIIGQQQTSEDLKDRQIAVLQEKLDTKTTELNKAAREIEKLRWMIGQLSITEVENITLKEGLAAERLKSSQLAFNAASSSSSGALFTTPQTVSHSGMALSSQVRDSLPTVPFDFSELAIPASHSGMELSSEVPNLSLLSPSFAAVINAPIPVLDLSGVADIFPEQRKSFSDLSTANGSLSNFKNYIVSYLDKNFVSREIRDRLRNLMKEVLLVRNDKSLTLQQKNDGYHDVRKQFQAISGTKLRKLH